MNTETETTTETKPPGRPLKRLLDLSERQMEHINSWLKEGVTCRKLVEFCRTEFQKEIPYMTFVRYANRKEKYDELQSLADNKEASAEMSRYAVTGDPHFTQNTLELLEQEAHDLALAYHRDGDAADLRTLKDLWALIHKAKAIAIRDRHATTQEDKRDLNREKFTHKIAIDQFRAELSTQRLELAQKTFHLRAKLTHHRLNLTHNPNLTPSGWHEAPAEFSRDGTEETPATPADQNAPAPFPLPAGEEGQGEGFRAQSNDARSADPNATPSASPKTSNFEPHTSNFDSSSSDNSKLKIKNSKLGQSAFAHTPEFLARSRQHTHDMITGKIKPKFIPPEIPCPDPDPLWDWLIDDYVPPPDVK